ncbi:MAG: MamK family actin-like protein [Planctomycetota bacterium]|jgi:rod shape-determining protein MreB|nr:MamK family actin-like protein [Planctomycetota bacterium]
MTSDNTMDTAKKDHGVLYIGMDLGTSRTSVSASNGIRETVYSMVGYPKDVVSKKLLKRDVLFGKEALEKRLSLKLYKPLEKGVLKCSGEGLSDEAKLNMKAAQDLIGEAIRLAKPRKDELIYCVIGAPAEASMKNKEAIIEAAREHVDSVMLCSEPFSVAYGLDWLEDVLVVDIGAGTTDLCRMHGTMPEESDQVMFDTAGDAVDAELERLIKQACPGAQVTIHMVKEIKERHGYVGEPAERIMVDLPVDGRPTAFDLTDQIRKACGVLIDPILKGITKLIASEDPEFQTKLKNRVLLAGGGSMVKGLDTAVERAMRERLGSGRVIRIEEPIYGGANGALKLAHDMPADYWEKLK